MTLFLRAILSKPVALYCSFFVCILSNNIAVASTNITLINPQASLTYSQDTVRLSQVLADSYALLTYQPYSFGVSLIDPKKQPTVEKKKLDVLNRLQEINSPTSNHLAKQLDALHFVYREKIETDPSKVRVNPALDPMIKGNYWLNIPTRPEHIFIINANIESSITLPLKMNSDLKDYLDELPDANSHTYDSAWIIQANQDVYQATDIQWQDKGYFLSPGAIIFIGLTNLPDEYQDLNADIAHFLTFCLEL